MTQTVVHFLDSPAFGGTEQALLHLLAGIDRQCWRPVLFHHDELGIAPLVEAASRLQVKTVVVPALRGARAMVGLPIILRRLMAERPVVFHAHLSWLLACKYGLMAAAWLRVPAIIATAQQYMQPPWGRTVFAQQQLVGAAVHRYIAVSQAVAQQLRQTFRVPAQKIQVIHNSIPWASFDNPCSAALRATLSAETQRPVVLTVARLDKQKGHTYLLEALGQVPEAILALAGDGPERTALTTLAQRLNLSERVIFLGHRNDIGDLLACCTLFVLPSIYEGLPLSVLEAMAAGKPVVATAVGGTPEALVHMETGLLVPPADPKALADAIRQILSDPERACRMGAAGRARVRREFSADSMAQRVMQVYTERLKAHEVSGGQH
jgi:glycosyltransferase involved in cell wall biosynthesis